eukprot:1143226-Pelagomonas_calceolata.AAC.1
MSGHALVSGRKGARSQASLCACTHVKDLALRWAITEDPGFGGKAAWGLCGSGLVTSMEEWQRPGSSKAPPPEDVGAQRQHKMSTFKAVAHNSRILLKACMRADKVGKIAPGEGSQNPLCPSSHWRS